MPECNENECSCEELDAELREQWRTESVLGMVNAYHNSNLTAWLARPATADVDVTITDGEDNHGA